MRVLFLTEVNMLGSLFSLCLAVLLGIIACSYTRRCTVRNLYASLDCIDADVTAAVRFVAGAAATVCLLAALRGLL